MKPSSRKLRIFGREFDPKETNKLIAMSAFVWMTCGTAFVYFYVKHIYGQRELLIIEKQKKLSREYNEVRSGAQDISRAEAVERMMARMRLEEKKED